MFAARSLKLATAVAGCAAVAAVAAPTASAGSADIIEYPAPGPVMTYFMGDALNCYIDARLTIEENADGWQSAYVEPVAIRPTIPGLPTPETCSATLLATWGDTTNRVPRMAPVRVDAGPGHADRARLDLDVQPGAERTSVSYQPQSMLVASLLAYPLGRAVTFYES